MDPITHGLLGAACAETAVGKPNRSIIWQAGAIAAMAPDLDIFIHIANQPLSGEIWHRSFTHALLFIPLGGMLVGLFLLLIPHFRKFWQLTLVSSLIGYATHCLLDACTSYGTLLFWPVSWERVSWDLVAIIDPFVTIPLLLGLIWTIVHRTKIGIIAGLLWVGMFLFINGLQHQRAIHNVEKFASDNNLILTDIRAMPFLASSTRWQIVAKTKQCIFIAKAHIPLMGKATINYPQLFPHFIPNSSYASGTPNKWDGSKIFSWFSDDYAIVASNSPLVIADGRYIANYAPATALWGIELNSLSSVKKLKQIHLTQTCR